jgi:hypothetical protein
MWAVGRLSLLSRGRAAAMAPAPPLVPIGAPTSPPAPPEAARVHTQEPRPPLPVAPPERGVASVEPTAPAVSTPPVASTAPGLLERVVSRVRRFFGSIFG